MAPQPSILHGFFRSSAAYRVRIALNPKGLKVETVSYRLREGEQTRDDYRALNPQSLVPTLELDDGTVLTQSLAIIEWLDETWRDPPLLPANPIVRAKTRAFAYAIAADLHPLQNLRVLRRIETLSSSQAAADWAKATNADGLEACERLLSQERGMFCFGDNPTLADLCLVPQLANARRFGVDVGQFPRLLAAEAACQALPAFAAAAPHLQPDAT